MHLRAFAIATAALLVPHGARAICGLAAPVAVSPHRGDVAPLNAHVVMSMPRHWRQTTSFSIKTAPAPNRARLDVSAKERSWITADAERVELVPDPVLAANTAYEVWTSRGELIGAFRTGDAADTTAPRWAGLKRGSAYKKTSQLSGRAGIIALSEECGTYRLSLWTDAAASDDQARDLRYAVWAAPANETIDYTTPPLGWARIDVDQQRLTMRVGTPFEYSLGYGNTDLDNDLELPTARPLLVGVRAIDLAGNASAPSELTVK